MNNPFNNPAFSMYSLTAAINIIPNRFGRIEALRIFPDKPVRTRQVMVEEQNGVLNLLPTMPVGAPGTVGTRAKRSLRSFVVPHIPHDDVVLPEEVQGIRAFGSETEMETIASVMARHLQTMRNKHAITLENLRMGALKGVILDADGSVIYNLFDEFGITPAVINFDLANASANIKRACANVLRHFEDNLKGEFMTAVHCLCSPEFFDALTEHPKVKDAFAYSQQRAVLIDDMRAGFTFGGVTFEEYRGQATDMNGVTRRFIAAGEAHAFPLGTVDTFSTYYAPADFNETANTLGQALYAKQEPRKFERGTDLHTQSNPLPMCHRPGVLVKLTMA
ncbi:MAG: major capsid protein [Rhodoferax sp.]|uniref:major capsid protein n=1 Tax=Rhodoferax sp. TaxID=50421 RepID=UPI001B68D885|nr:major capsid protein [Rhodoferax sp.]MBP9904507.1 major capsid protein [Rhodoferax sp.]